MQAVKTTTTRGRNSREAVEHGASAGRRRLIDGIRWRVRTGAPWQDLPAEYGTWQTVYGLFRRGSVTGSGRRC
ncbi:hypothetical protein GCM10018779_51040 [Streptomyces griseocarneus]|nr:hypothetical protein GCM10018779_51040 [Streptomyces griseocarneus]